ncbi:hypothetical protein [Curtobacterium sp. SAFR-003]
MSSDGADLTREPVWIAGPDEMIEQPEADAAVRDFLDDLGLS